MCARAGGGRPAKRSSLPSPPPQLGRASWPPSLSLSANHSSRSQPKSQLAQELALHREKLGWEKSQVTQREGRAEAETGQPRPRVTANPEAGTCTTPTPSPGNRGVWVGGETRPCEVAGEDGLLNAPARRPIRERCIGKHWLGVQS